MIDVNVGREHLQEMTVSELEQAEKLLRDDWKRNVLNYGSLANDSLRKLKKVRKELRRRKGDRPERRGWLSFSRSE